MFVIPRHLCFNSKKSSVPDRLKRLSVKNRDTGPALFNRSVRSGARSVIHPSVVTDRTNDLFFSRANSISAMTALIKDVVYDAVNGHESFDSYSPSSVSLVIVLNRVFGFIPEAVIP